MYRLLRPLLFRLDAESAHAATLRWAGRLQQMGLGPVASWYGFEDQRLQQTLWGLRFPNPVGLAAGADKNIRHVPFWTAIGCGFVEGGSVSAQPASGNPQPRAFRLPDDDAIINRMGLNNDGAEAVAAHVRTERERFTRPLGINLAKTHSPDIMGTAALEDFRSSFRMLAPLAGYIALNVSCPNTREGKTFEAPDALDALLGMIMEERKTPERRVPVLIKLSPPLTPRVVFDTALEELIAVAESHDVDGYIATNTAADRAGLTTDAATLAAIGPGGLSGPPLAARSNQLIRYLYRATGGATPIIGVGGVDSAAAAYDKIAAGASLVQCYTGLVYQGPGLIKSIKEGLVEHLKRDGFASIQDAVGHAVHAAEARGDAWRQPQTARAAS
ncbi:quinone-dependent dihydroorotate dehydrogenase [Salisaeta longa]|uniref:quinone-dependent dihydroorotate dehydrogenase n=1 Tax=Salisaeta longa TaxID=503170 RepID=UPI0003B3475D|nr:quinone-dependent dihydroorotate dehydrogenase [Salisaeta longa]